MNPLRPQSSVLSPNLAALLAPTYLPTSPDHFTGPAQRAAHIIDKLVAARFPDKLPIKLALIGPPGTGKTALCKYLAHRLNLNPLDRHHYAGADVDLDRARSLAEAAQYAPVGPYRLIHIDEADTMTPAALKRMLVVLDEVPNRNAYVLTANSDLSQIEERFQTRFKPIKITGPTTAEITEFLLPYLGDNPPLHHIRALKSIAEKSSGNVRSAIDDLDTYLLTQ